MEIKNYKKDAFYSYSLGAFPTIELLKNHPHDVLKILIHSSFKNQDVINMINDLRGHAEMQINDKLISHLSPKENCFIIGIFKKYHNELDDSQDHILLDNPSNMGNLGTIIRSSLGFGIKNIAIIKPGVDIFDPKVIRSSMGACFSVNIQFFDSYESYKSHYRTHTSYAFMLKAKKTLQQVQFTKGKVTLIFGNEATGLPDKYLDNNSLIITHSKDIDSLNLPTAVGIALYEFNKQKNN